MRITINRMRGSLAYKVGSGQAVFRLDGILARDAFPKLPPTSKAGPFSPGWHFGQEEASKHLLLISLWSSMRVRLFSDSLFNLADSLLNFPDILFSSAISFQVGVLGKLAGLLLDCAFDFVKLACCLIVRAGFHRDSLLCLVVGFY